MSAKDGGPAFPRSDGGVSVTHDGMSLRDYFAAHAPMTDNILQSANDVAMETAPQTGERYGEAFCRLLTEHAYRYADAMLRAREKGAPQS